MTKENMNVLFFANFNPESIDDEVPNCIGFYSFRILETHDGELTDAMIYGMSVRLDDGCVSMVYDGGDPPRAAAGLALDLHQAAVARIKARASEMLAATAFYIGDDGKIAECETSEYWPARALAAVKAAPTLAAGNEVYDLAVGGRLPLSNPPSPPAPARCP